MEINKMTYTYRQAGSTAGRAGTSGTSRGNALHYGNSFADKMADAGAERDNFPGNKDGESCPALYQGLPGAWQNATANAYTALSAFGARVHEEAPSKGNYETYESANYRIVPDNEAGCFTIYNKQGERIGAFSYQDIKIRQDAASGQQFLISEHGTMSYDAVTLDDELKEDLLTVMGIDSLETETLQGFTLKTHSGTGIRYLLRDGEEGRGGKVLLQNEEDVRKYEALAETYLNKYPNLIKDKTAAYIYADLEIKGSAKHIEWLQNNDESVEDLYKLPAWQKAEKKSERNVWEQSFEQIGVNAPASVKQAWMEAAEAAGVDGMGVSANGKLTHISQLMVQRLLKGERGENAHDVLGSSVQSAIRAAKEALYALEHPLVPQHGKSPEEMAGRIKERKFYQEFISRLEAV